MAGAELRILASIAAIIFIFVSAISAQEVRFESETLEKKDSVYTLTGAVKVSRGEASVQADRILYDEATGDAYAEGNVHFEDPDVTVTAERAEVNLTSRLGVLYNAELLVKKEGYRIRGEEIRQEGEGRYRLKRASATTCEGPVPDWCVGGKEVDVFLGEYVAMKHATFRVKGVPVLYTPHFWAPIITERRTGLLSPEMGYRSSRGFFYSQPYFWAISENRDMTLKLDYYTKRAFGQGVEYRYIERPGLEGQMNLYHLRDGVIDRDYYEVRGLQKFERPYISAFLELNLINYREYYRRYEPYLHESSLRYLESRSEITVPVGNSRAYVLGQYFQELKEGVDTDTVLQRLPEAGFFVAPRRLGSAVITGAAAVSNFRRQSGTDGVRYDANIRASHTVGIGPSLSQSFGVREAAYSFDESDTGDESINNEIFDYNATVHMRAYRDYGDIRHEVIPTVSYTYVTRDGEEPPLFDVLELTEEASVAELAIVNRISDAEGEFLTVKAAQPYDFKGGERPLRPLRFDMSVARPVNVKVSLTHDVHDAHVNSADSTLSFALPRTTVSAGQRYTRDPNLTLFTFETDFRATDVLALNGRIWYDSDGGGLRELAVSAQYNSQCWAARLSVVKRPDDYGVFFRVNLLGLGEYKM